MRRLLLCCLVLGLARVAPADEATDAVQARLTAYLDVFNKNDLQALAGYWAEEAVSVDEETGERTVGRQAILDDFSSFFSSYPNSRLTGVVDHVRLVRPEVAIVEGQVTLFTPDAEPTLSAFTAVMVQKGGNWVIESSNERELPSPASPAAALSDLEWLIGQWQDESDAVSVTTTVRWSANNAFLIRSYVADFGEGDALEGTQVIGWDPAAKQVRVWNFNSDGSFGDGVATHSGDEWLIRLTEVMSDGQLSTSTQVLRRVDSDHFTVQKIGQTVGGDPLPSSSLVEVVRTAPAPTE